MLGDDAVGMEGTGDVDGAANMLVSAFRLMILRAPGMYEKPGGSGVVTLVTGAPRSRSNGAGPRPWGGSKVRLSAPASRGYTGNNCCVAALGGGQARRHHSTDN
jgi:hypothetical protein